MDMRIIWAVPFLGRGMRERGGRRTGFGFVLLIGLLDAPACHLNGITYLLAACCLVLGFLRRGAPVVP